MVRRIVTAIANCLIDLKLVGYKPISRGVRTSALEAWNRIYLDEYVLGPRKKSRIWRPETADMRGLNLKRDSYG